MENREKKSNKKYMLEERKKRLEQIKKTNEVFEIVRDKMENNK